MTVGIETPIMNAARPGDGSVCSASESSTVPCRGVRRFDQRRLAGDRDALGDRADFHRQIEREELLRADADAAAVDRLVALQRRLDRVVAGVDVGEHVFAALVGHRRPLDVGLLVGQRDFNAGNDAARVLDRSAQASLEPLPEDRTRGGHD